MKINVRVFHFSESGILANGPHFIHDEGTLFYYSV